jgi:hypothetical protein
MNASAAVRLECFMVRKPGCNVLQFDQLDDLFFLFSRLVSPLIFSVLLLSPLFDRTNHADSDFSEGEKKASKNQCINDTNQVCFVSFHTRRYRSHSFSPLNNIPKSGSKIQKDVFNGAARNGFRPVL